MLLCPVCDSLLLFKSSVGGNSFNCRCCPYKFPLLESYTKNVKISKQRKLNEIFTEQNESLSKIDINCPKCPGTSAYYFQMQTRSADEASTIFYRCIQCNYTWKDN